MQTPAAVIGVHVSRRLHPPKAAKSAGHRLGGFWPMPSLQLVSVNISGPIRKFLNLSPIQPIDSPFVFRHRP
jgi:hypothetical protein